MPRLRLLLGSLCLAGLFASPLKAQPTLFTVPELSSKQLQTEALQLAQDAVRLAQITRYSEAEAYAALAVQLAAKNAQTQTIYGVISLQNNKPEQALVALQRASELDPDNARVFFYMALVHQRQKNYAKVASALEKGLKIDPKATEEYFNLGNAYVLLNRREDALRTFQKAVSLKNTFWEAINNIGLLNYEIGNIDEARNRWQEAVRINEKAAEPRLALGVATYAAGDRQRGLNLSEEALTLDKRYAELTYLKENLWGEKLLAATAEVLATPEIKAALKRIPDPVDEETTAANP